MSALEKKGKNIPKLPEKESGKHTDTTNKLRKLAGITKKNRENLSKCQKKWRKLTQITI